MFQTILGVGGDDLRSGFGIDFDLSETGRGVCNFDLDRFGGALSDDFDRVCDFLLRESAAGTQEGLILSLIEALEGIQTDLLRDGGSGPARGLLIAVSV